MNDLYYDLPELREAVFIKRENRFAARVSVDGEELLAHVPNSGRLNELFQKGNRVYVQMKAGARTRCRLMLAECGNSLALIDSHLTNDILEFLIRGNAIIDCPVNIKREVRYGKSRLDLACENSEGIHLVEAKCVTLVKDGKALFPDAPTDRGRRHLEELVHAVSEGYIPHIVFIVQIDGADCFTANRETDPAFADAFRKARENGVSVHAVTMEVCRNHVRPIGFLKIED